MAEPAATAHPDREIELRLAQRDLDPKRLDARALKASAAQAPWREGAVSRWPLWTLVAWLANGFSRDELRALLARGEWESAMTRARWEPLVLSDAELSAVERRFPPPLAEPVREPTGGPSEVRLVTPAVRPIAWVGLDKRAAVVREAARRWRYIGFDTGAWADRWETAVTPDEARTLLAKASSTTRVGGRELADRLGMPVPEIIATAGAPPAAAETAHGYLARLTREIGAWYEALFARAATELGVAARFTGQRPGEPAPWPATSTAWRPRP